MSYRQQASRYQDVQVLSASPAQLVVLLYDHLLVSLRRAGITAQANELEQRAEHIASCQDIVGELLSTLDRDRGGALAANLSGLYTFLLTELVSAGHGGDISRLDRLSVIVAELRDAFAQAGSQVQRSTCR